MIGIDVLALQREAFRSCKPDTYLFTGKPVIPSSAEGLRVSSHGNVFEERIKLSRIAIPRGESEG